MACWIAGSEASGVIVATYRSLLGTWLRVQMATTDSGASTQATTIMRVATSDRQRWRPTRPAPGVGSVSVPAAPSRPIRARKAAVSARPPPPRLPVSAGCPQRQPPRPRRIRHHLKRVISLPDSSRPGDPARPGRGKNRVRRGQRPRGAAMGRVPPSVSGPGSTRPAPKLDAGRLWTGGLATAAVAALVAVVGVLIARGVFDVPVLAPTGEGTLGDASTARLAGLAALCALLATRLLHLLLRSNPPPPPRLR